jgi:hypothetical protein
MPVKTDIELIEHYQNVEYMLQRRWDAARIVK